MENGWSLFNNNSSSTTIGSSRGGQNGHCTTTTTSHNLAWELWDLSTARFDWSITNHNNSLSLQEPPPAAADGGVIGVHALMAHPAASASSLYAGAGSHYHPDPHLVCLNLGKRHYFEDATLVGDRRVDGVSSSIGKRGRPVYGGGFVGPAAVTEAVPKCQVDGCHVALLNAKEYHRRHKVCEMHSKAPKVVVLGADQRFCQQCSRFHAVSEFDESKRSCRRRLAGHNERRRKGSHDHIIPRNPSQGRALSLLSSKSNTWFSSSADLSYRCSAALGELIAENRAANLARQLVIDREWPINQHHHSMEDADPNGTSSQNHLFSGWNRYNEGHGGHVTLDLMQAQDSAFGLLSVRGKSKDEEEEGCSEFMWRSLGGSHEI